MTVGTMQDLLHVEENFEICFNKISTKSFLRKLGAGFWYSWKTSMT
jgi:hypothetical protein